MKYSDICCSVKAWRYQQRRRRRRQQHIMTNDRPCTILHFNYIQGNRGKITQWSLVWGHAKISRKESTCATSVK